MPFGGKDGRLGAWRALVESQKAGKARSIGVSNFGLHHLKELEEYIQRTGEGRIEVGQYELHPWLGRAELVDWLRERDVLIEAYFPLARGTRMDEPILWAISKKHGKNPAQVLIRWSLQKVRFDHDGLMAHGLANIILIAFHSGFCAAAKICYPEAHPRECGCV